MRTRTYPDHKVHHRNHPTDETTDCGRSRSGWSGVLEDTGCWALVTCLPCLRHRPARKGRS